MPFRIVLTSQMAGGWLDYVLLRGRLLLIPATVAAAPQRRRVLSKNAASRAEVEFDRLVVEQEIVLLPLALSIFDQTSESPI